MEADCPHVPSQTNCVQLNFLAGCDVLFFFFFEFPAVQILDNARLLPAGGSKRPKMAARYLK